MLLLEWDVRGVAAGTAVSEWLATCIGLGLLCRHLYPKIAHRIVWRSVFEGGRFKTLFGVSRDLILRSFLVQLPFFVFTAAGATLGNTVLAANAVLMQLFFFMAFGLNSFAHVSEALVGYAVGARDPVELRAATAYTAWWSLIFALCISATYFVAGGHVIDMLTDLPQVRSTARDYLPWMMVTPLLAAGAFQLDGIYIGAAQTGYLRNTMLLSVLVFGSTLWLTLDAFGNHALWLALATFLAFRAASLAACYPAMAREAIAGSRAVERVRGTNPTNASRC